MLLDTHVLIWLLADDARLGRTAKERIRAEQSADRVLVSFMNFFEASTLVRRRRVNLGASLEQWTRTVLTSSGVSLVANDVQIAIDAGQLPREIHGDPGDRILIATAIRHSVPLLTADGPILDYAAAGHLQAIDARH